MKFRTAGERRQRFVAWSASWLRKLPDADLALYAELARQQFSASARMTKNEALRAQRTMAEFERRAKLCSASLANAA